MSRFEAIVSRLEAVIESRRGADPAGSWSARLLADRPLAAKKLAEEALETALAAVQGDRAALIAENADLIYHWLVLLAASGVTRDEIAEALEAREGRSGVAEKAARGA
jgi:phosphoribosyl-ATP pyrophosphohydrolase